MTFRVALALFTLTSVAGAQELTFTPFHSNGIYQTGENAGWVVRRVPGVPATAGVYSYSIRKNNLDVLKNGSLDVSGGSAKIEIAVNEPAMLYVEVESHADGAPGGSPVHLQAAVAPAGLKPSTPRPADFDAFWDSKLKALREIPVNPSLYGFSRMSPVWN